MSGHPHPPVTTALFATSTPPPSLEEGEISDPDIHDLAQPSAAPEATLNPPSPELKPLDEEELKVVGHESREWKGQWNLSDFEGMEKVGQGTFGEVLLAVCRKTKDKVALKRIIVHKEKDGIPITSIRELTTLKRSSHPNVLSFLGMALETPASSSDSTSQQWDPPTLYMVLPYMDHDLAGLLENRKVVLGASVIKSFMKQLCEGVKYIHQNNILHRDLKTSNVLISNSGHLTLGDFGLARSIAPQNFIHHPDDPTSTTRRGVDLTPNVITLWYRPPELVLGERNYGTAVDMWGVGCIFAEMWDRRPLFRADTEVDLLTAQLSILGTPTPTAWPSFSSLCTSAHIVPAKNFERRLKSVYHERRMEERTAEVLEGLLRWDPTKRMTAMEVLEADYFCVEPEAARVGGPEFPGWPTSHELGIRKQVAADKSLTQAVGATDDAKEGVGFSANSSTLRAHTDALLTNNDAPLKAPFIPHLVAARAREQRGREEEERKREREEGGGGSNSGSNKRGRMGGRGGGGGGRRRGGNRGRGGHKGGAADWQQQQQAATMAMAAMGIGLGMSRAMIGQFLGTISGGGGGGGGGGSHRGGPPRDRGGGGGRHRGQSHQQQHQQHQRHQQQTQYSSGSHQQQHYSQHQHPQQHHHQPVEPPVKRLSGNATTSLSSTATGARSSTAPTAPAPTRASTNRASAALSEVVRSPSSSTSPTKRTHPAPSVVPSKRKTTD